MSESKKPERIMLRVGGELIPKPSNERDPKRRYSAVSPLPDFPNESILVEFTEEQERQRDAEETKWAAEKPLREERAKAERQQLAEFRAGLKYEIRFVAFLDVLGWAAAIEESTRNPELVKDLGLAQHGLSMHRDWVYQTKALLGPQQDLDQDDLQLTQFSDSIIVSVRDNASSILYLQSTLRFLIHGLLMRGLLVRGAIAHGLAIHRQSFAYGPAIVSAFDLERHVALYPRVILAADIVDRVTALMRVQNSDGQFIGYFKHWRRDADGLWFLDYLEPFLGDTFRKPETPMIARDLRRYRRIIEAGLANTRRKPDRFLKLRWLAEYFNGVCAEYADAAVPPITWSLPPR